MESTKGKARSPRSIGKTTKLDSDTSTEPGSKSPLNGESEPDCQQIELDKSTEDKQEEMNVSSVSEEPPKSDATIISEETSAPPVMKIEKDESYNNTDVLMSPSQSLGKGKRARIPNKRYSDIALSPQSTAVVNKSSASPSGTVSLANGVRVKNEKIESESERDELPSTSSSVPSRSRSNTNSPQPSRNKGKPDLADPVYLKPFTLGWKRELVYRAVYHNPNKPEADVYYYSPVGKKLRSMREVSHHIDNNVELSISNFSFFKEPLNLNDTSREIIRVANPQGRGKLQKQVDSDVKASTSKTSTPNVKTVPVSPATSKSPSAATSSPPPENKTNNRKRPNTSVSKKTRPQKKPKLDESVAPSSTTESPTTNTRRTSRKTPAKLTTTK